MIEKFVKVILASLFVLISQQVVANECVQSLRISYSDGEKGCFTDLPFSKQLSKEWKKPLEDVAQHSNYYAVAVSETCEEVGFSSTMATDTKAYSQIDSRALANCQKGCDCKILVRNGNVLDKNLKSFKITSKLLSKAKEKTKN